MNKHKHIIYIELANLDIAGRCAEHVQRFSACLLRRLSSCCLQSISGWSEMSVPTLCGLGGSIYLYSSLSLSIYIYIYMYVCMYVCK